MNSTIDLHIHSYYSDDGEYSPAELAGICAAAGVSLFAIADHNTVRGVEEGIRAAQKRNACCYPAIEIDCTYQQTNLHLLGYMIDHESRDFQEIEDNIRRQTAHASRERLRLVNGLGFHVKAKQVQALAEKSYWPESLTAELMAEVLLGDATYADSPLLLPYRAGGHRSDNPYVNFYWDFCAQGKQCYVPLSFPDIKEMIELIHRNHGIAVLAHPGANLAGRDDVLEALIPLGLDGLEAYSSYHDAATAKRYADMAKKHGLLLSLGSDFHGKIKPSVSLGKAQKG